MIDSETPVMMKAKRHDEINQIFVTGHILQCLFVTHLLQTETEMIRLKEVHNGFSDKT